MPVPGPPPRPLKPNAAELAAKFQEPSQAQKNWTTAQQEGRRKASIQGRRKCTVCGRIPNSMTEHWGKESATHGPMSTENPDALRNLPGLDQLSQHLGGIFTDRRM